MNPKIYLPIILLVLCGSSSAQELPVWGFYVPALSHLNAGAWHADSVNYAFAMHRSQWVNYRSSFGEESGAIVSNLLMARFSPKNRRHAFGVTFLHDNTTGIRHHEFRLAYAYRVNLSQSSFLSLGMSVDGINKGVNIDEYRVEFTSDSRLPVNTTEFRPDMSAGIYWRHQSGAFLGMSANRLLQSRYPVLFIQTRRLYHITGGYSWAIANDWRLLPSFIIYHTLPRYTAEATLSVSYKQFVQMGLSYRRQEAVGFLFNFTLWEGNLIACYGAEHILRAENAKSNISQEIGLKYIF